MLTGLAEEGRSEVDGCDGIATLFKSDLLLGRYVTDSHPA
jgi:hypothetical protein